MSKFKIVTHPESCAGCLRCQLVCSQVYTRVFNPSAAWIRIDLSTDDYTISFTGECNDCGRCVDHCFYGALEKVTKE